MTWWISERAIKQWLPKVRTSVQALVARGYVEEHKTADGHVFYRLNRAGPRLQRRSRKKERGGESSGRA
jgi:hypothetical protein